MIHDLAALGDGYAAGLEEVMADHEGTAAGQRARTAWAFTTATPAISKAPSLVEEINVGDDVVQVLAAGNIGDCYVELADYESAQAAFNNAISLATSSMAEDVLAPMFLYKVHSLKSSWATTPKPKAPRPHRGRLPHQPTEQRLEALAASLAEG